MVENEIEDAQIISETIENGKNKSTVTVDAEELDNNSGKQKVKINLKNIADIDNFTQKQTKTVEETTPITEKENSTNLTAEQIREAESKQTVDPETLGMVSEFMIEIFNTILSNVLNFIAKDKASSAYEIAPSKVQLLSKMLKNILIKWGAKFSIEGLFFITLIVVCIPPVRKSTKLRKVHIKIQDGEELSENDKKVIVQEVGITKENLDKQLNQKKTYTRPAGGQKK